VPQGTVGEIFSRIEAYLDFNYHNKDSMRAEVERHSFITCGDIGYLDADGYLFICDRRRDMVISGGVNIYPAEIESVLYGVDGVHDCAAFGIPDSEFGEALMAVVEPADGAVLSPDTIRAHLSAHLADYTGDSLLRLCIRLLPQLQSRSENLDHRDVKLPPMLLLGRRVA
jgi:long-chain acyl-CoA synthetase